MKEILEVKLYNVEEAAALLEVASQTVRKNIKEIVVEALSACFLFLEGKNGTINL